jgi:hypothetical protein
MHAASRQHGSIRQHRQHVRLHENVKWLWRAPLVWVRDVLNVCSVGAETNAKIP